MHMWPTLWTITTCDSQDPMLSVAVQKSKTQALKDKSIFCAFFSSYWLGDFSDNAIWGILKFYRSFYSCKVLLRCTRVWWMWQISGMVQCTPHTNYPHTNYPSNKVLIADRKRRGRGSTLTVSLLSSQFAGMKHGNPDPWVLCMYSMQTADCSDLFIDQVSVHTETHIFNCIWAAPHIYVGPILLWWFLVTSSLESLLFVEPPAPLDELILLLPRN